MRSALWPDEPEAELARQSDAFLQEHGSDATMLTEVFVSETAPGQITGFLELFVRNIAEGCVGRTPYVEGWYVDPPARGAGVGRALMNAAEVWARDHGYAVLGSDTEVDNEASQGAHRALGFAEVARIVHFRKAL